MQSTSVAAKRQFTPTGQVSVVRDHYPRGSKDEEVPGTWHPVVEEIDGRRLVVGAWVHCPQCGHRRALHHEILNTGEVNPEVVCPSHSCNYRKHIHLDEWSGGNLPASVD